jgi:hypothetical protein
MHLRESKLIFSPSDLTNYMESKFVSFMDRLSLQQDPRAIKDAPDESMQIIRDRGMQHERAYLELLKQNGNDVCEIPDKAADGIQLTLEAIKSGKQIIYQAHLSTSLVEECLSGYARHMSGRSQSPPER